uniref:Putative e3 ubiquitin-protein ligase bre1-like 2 n=1 Tax=Panstrongylus lignarius TaxID=156445 RepID=A0A224XJF1_9HEMI
MATVTHHKIPVENWLGSNSYTGKRVCHKLSQTLPKFDELKQTLGIPLTELIFEYGIPDIVTRQQGDDERDDELEGAKKPLWASPSEQLQEKLKLKIPIIRRGQQVLCYQNVLDIGEEVERELQRKNEEEIERRTQEIYKEIKEEFDREIDRIRDRLKRDMFELYTLRLKQIFCKLWKEFEDHITERENILLAEAEKDKNEAVNVVRKSMEEELLCAVEKLENNYKLRSDFIAEWDRNQIHEEYLEKINMYNNKWTDLVNQAEESEKVKLAAIADNLRTVYQLNLLEVIAAERDLANRMIEDTALYFIQRIHDLQKQVKKLFTTLIETNEQLKINRLEFISWKCLLTDVVGQFQKFVNYVLLAVPGDAEYLLSLEKLLERREQTFAERMKAVGEITEDIYPMPSWEKLSIPETIESEHMSVVIQSIMEFILYRGMVEVTKKRPHEGVVVKEKKRRSSASTSTLTLISSVSSSVSFSVVSELSTTISLAASSQCICTTDKSFASRRVCPQHMDKQFWGEGIDYEMEQIEEELANDFISELSDMDGEAIMDHLIYGDIWYLGSRRGVNDEWDPDALLFKKDWLDESELFGEELDEYELYGEYSSIISPTVITEYLQSLQTGQEFASGTSTISLETQYLDSDFISSTSIDLGRCEDGTLIRTKSAMELEAERFAKKCADLKFMGTDFPPTPKDKETFVQGRILSILDIMRVHPKLHNILVEP